MGIWIAVWRRLRTWAGMAALCAMMMYGYYLAGDREVEAIFRGFLGTALVGGPWLAVFLVLEWITRSAESRRENRERADGDRLAGRGRLLYSSKVQQLWKLRISQNNPDQPQYILDGPH